MEKETKYGIIEQVGPQFPVRKLLVVRHRGGDLTVSYPAFGPNTYKGNLEEMSKDYSHPQTGERISFREPTTAESISAAAYEFENLAKPEIFDSRWLQAGYIVRTQDGVFTNTKITDEDSLKKLLDKAEKVNGIYLIDDKMAFAPYETFKQGMQDCDTFSHGGLARALEHTQEKVATNLREIASPKFYKRGVNVWSFDSVKEPVLRIASLDSDRGLDRDGLGIGGYGGYEGRGGYAFGVLKKSAEGTRAEK